MTCRQHAESSHNRKAATFNLNFSAVSLGAGIEPLFTKLDKVNVPRLVEKFSCSIAHSIRVEYCDDIHSRNWRTCSDLETQLLPVCFRLKRNGIASTLLPFYQQLPLYLNQNLFNPKRCHHGAACNCQSKCKGSNHLIESHIFKISVGTSIIKSNKVLYTGHGSRILRAIDLFGKRVSLLLKQDHCHGIWHRVNLKSEVVVFFDVAVQHVKWIPCATSCPLSALEDSCDSYGNSRMNSARSREVAKSTTVMASPVVSQLLHRLPKDLEPSTTNTSETSESSVDDSTVKGVISMVQSKGADVRIKRKVESQKVEDIVQYNNRLVIDINKVAQGIESDTESQEDEDKFKAATLFKKILNTAQALGPSPRAPGLKIDSKQGGGVQEEDGGEEVEDGNEDSTGNFLAFNLVQKGYDLYNMVVGNDDEEDLEAEPPHSGSGGSLESSKSSGVPLTGSGESGGALNADGSGAALGVGDNQTGSGAGAIYSSRESGGASDANPSLKNATPPLLIPPNTVKESSKEPTVTFPSSRPASSRISLQSVGTTFKRRWLPILIQVDKIAGTCRKSNVMFSSAEYLLNEVARLIASKYKVLDCDFEMLKYWVKMEDIKAFVYCVDVQGSTAYEIKETNASFRDIHTCTVESVAILYRVQVKSGNNLDILKSKLLNSSFLEDYFRVAKVQVNVDVEDARPFHHENNNKDLWEETSDSGVETQKKKSSRIARQCGLNYQDSNTSVDYEMLRFSSLNDYSAANVNEHLRNKVHENKILLKSPRTQYPVLMQQRWTMLLKGMLDSVRQQREAVKFVWPQQTPTTVQG